MHDLLLARSPPILNNFWIVYITFHHTYPFFDRHYLIEIAASIMTVLCNRGFVGQILAKKTYRDFAK
jgi:hypothetical protein